MNTTVRTSMVIGLTMMTALVQPPSTQAQDLQPCTQGKFNLIVLLNQQSSTPTLSLFSKPESTSTSPGTRPAPSVNATLAVAARNGNAITTRTPGFLSWFRAAVDRARSTWKLPTATNRYGKVVSHADVLRAIILIESQGVHSKNGVVTLSSAKALGFTQLIPTTAAELRVNPRDPAQNLLGGALRLRDCFASKATQVAGDGPADRIAKAAASYNTGPNRAALANQTWARFVTSKKAAYLDEPTQYGIRLKMALGLNVSATEKQWLARHKKMSAAAVDALERQLYSQALGLIPAQKATQA